MDFIAKPQNPVVKFRSTLKKESERRRLAFARLRLMRENPNATISIVEKDSAAVPFVRKIENGGEERINLIA